MTAIKLRAFFATPYAGGVLLMFAAVFALAWANSPLSVYYDLLLNTHFSISIGDQAIDKPILLWINDGLMAVFFFLVGLEIKRELLVGQLSSFSNLSLPLVGAIGGMVLPSVIYAAVNWGNATALSGWAIPAATDIAFALGIMALLGDRVPTALKLMLLAVAIIDDLGAIVIIALFYTDNLSVQALLFAAFGGCVLWILNRYNVTKLTPYIVVGLFVWVCVLKSGVHATLAGVLVAFSLPLRGNDRSKAFWTQRIEHKLHGWVAFGVLPIFAFANAGVSLGGVQFNILLHPISLGIILGLVVGKQLGVFGAMFIAVKLGFGKLPKGVGWAQLYGMAALCGVGFTMSLFIGSLAFEETGNDNFIHDRIGILAGSLIASVLGYFTLRVSRRNQVAEIKRDIVNVMN